MLFDCYIGCPLKHNPKSTLFSFISTDLSQSIGTSFVFLAGFPQEKLLLSHPAMLPSAELFQDDAIISAKWTDAVMATSLIS